MARERTQQWLFPGMGFVAVLLLAWIRSRTAPYSGLGDFYPLYHGAEALLQRGDVYSLDPALPDIGSLSSIGNAYPMHAAVLLGLPMAWMEPHIAGPVWIAAVGLAWVAAIRWSEESWAWLLWWPMWDSLRIGQPTSAVTVAAIVAVGGLRKGNRSALLMAMVVLSIKPQQTLLLMIGLAWLGRRWWRSMVAVGVLAAAVTVVLQPDWLAKWVTQVSARNELLQGESFLTPALLALAAWLAYRGWTESALAVGSNSVALWPATGHYSAALWPLGLSDRASLAAAITAAIGFLAALLFPLSWGVPLMLMLSVAAATWAFPKPKSDSDWSPRA